ncbi:MATE family efflux transporter [Pseudoroseicyclus tamaricis]|uniref:Multidrug-efflux transporter n=1 Tax=Pseudoroseicyclus tamaricis TaxID=2705421 RepID=A0A6B2JYY5_9RHOB|nr:MATE family efflux transporter [Pseudoroseicyclus tamaricis]NDV01504.1 MATE family efflux transporter [Pseudoroseicyclus tamaricis]
MSARPSSLSSHAGALFRIGLPLVGASVANFLIHMTDTLMLGWYSVTALAAATIATNVWFVLFIMGAGFGIAVAPVVSSAAARGDAVRARRFTRMAMWLTLAYAALAVIPLWFSEPLLLAMGQPPEVAEAAQGYLRIAAFGLFGALFATAIRGFLGALELTGVQLWITVAGVGLNAGINYCLIFGNLGAPELGIVGAAIASVILEIAMAVAAAVYAARKAPQFELFVRFWKPDWEALGQAFRLGFPIGLTALAESGMFSGSAIMMGWIGEVELAAHGIAMQLTALLFMFHVGMSQAATVRAGGAVGRGSAIDLKRTAITAQAISVLFGFVVVAILLIWPAELVGLFVDPEDPLKPQIVAFGVPLLAIAALFQFADGGQATAMGLLRGVQDMRVPMVIACLSYWLVGLGSAWLLAFPLGLGPEGLWFGLTLGLTAAVIGLALRFWLRSIRLVIPPGTVATDIAPA